MNKSFLADIKTIKRDMQSRKLVVFAGAGISIDAGVPTWSELIKKISGEIDLPVEEKDYLKIAQMYFNERQQKEFTEAIRSFLKFKKIKHNEIHKEIFRLNPEHILTTNYDDLLEQVIASQALPFSVIRKDKELPYASNTRLLVKIHGDLDDSCFVLKEDDYLNYTENYPLIESFLKSVFATKTILFVGYGFSDINLKLIIQNVRNILGDDYQNAYLINLDKTVHPSQREYFKNKGIKVLNYYDGDLKNKKNYIEEYLEGKNAFKEKYIMPGTNLSDVGQRLFNFIRFISVYDTFNAPIVNPLELIDQIYNSLSRFSELNFLPPEFITGLYPLNTEKKTYGDVNQFALLASNEKIEDLFFSQLNIRDGILSFTPPANLNLKKKEIETYEKKLNSIIHKLNKCLVFYVFKRTKTPDSMGVRSWSKEYVEIKLKKVPEKPSPLSMFTDLKFDKSFEGALSSTLNESSSTETDLMIGYVLFKFGNFHKASQIFETTAQKAWETGKYFSYFIAKYNFRTMRYLLSQFETAINDEKKDEIFNEMEDIDFDKLLSQIPYSSDEEYSLLKNIRSKDILSKADAEISFSLNEIERIFDIYSWGGSSTGTNYSNRIYYNELLKLISFYVNNCIVLDEFNNLTRIVQKGLKGLIISYAIPEEYSERFKHFDVTFFVLFTFYGNYSELKHLVKKYKITEISYKPADLDKCILLTNNFLNSFYRETNLSGTISLPNSDILNLTNNAFFSNKCHHYFKKIFTMFSLVTIPKESENGLVDNLINFLKHENFIWGQCITELSNFIEKNHLLFTRKNFIDLLQIAHSKTAKYNWNEFYCAFSYAFEKNGFNNIEEDRLILNLIEEIEKDSKSSYAIIDLWKISNAEIKNKLITKLKSKLVEKFDPSLFEISVDEGLLEIDDFINQYIEKINKEKGQEFDYYIGSFKQFNYLFLRSLAFLIRNKVKDDDPRLEKFSNLSDYQKFYLHPKEFDFVNFDIEWLLYYPRKEFFEKFRDIPEIKKRIEESLKGKYEEQLSKIYLKYFLF